MSGMSTQTLYGELAGRISPRSARDLGRTERTADRETIDNDRAMASLASPLAASASITQNDPGRTEVTAVVETMDRDRYQESLYSTLADRANHGLVDHGRTLETKAVETIDRDRHPARQGSHVFGPTDDLYGVLASPALPGDPDYGRTEITRVKSETIDQDRAPIYR